MIEDWKQLIAAMNIGVGDLRKGAPDIMRSFAEMGRAAHAGAALDGKTKELVALAIGVSTRCAPCIAYHAEGAAKKGASRAEVLETMAIAIYMGAGPSAMYAAQALEAFDQLNVAE
ncbi:carboxymuconolactone decarboxylase family protein [Sphingomonas oryzagri]